MATTSWAFDAGQRTPQDGGWFIAFLVSLLGVVVMGFRAWNTANPLFQMAAFHSGFMNDPSHCEASNDGRQLLAADEDIDIDHLGHVAVIGVLASAVLATIAALALIQLFRKAPQTMVIIGCILPIAFFTVLALVAPSPVSLTLSLICVLLLCLVYGHCAFVYRVKLVGRLMQVAADALAANTGLFPFAIGANLAQLAPLLGFGATLYFLQGNGDPVRNPDSISAHLFSDRSVGTSSQCMDMDGKSVSCCVWKPEGWVLPVQMLVGIIGMWTLAIIGQLRVHVLGGVITQWYFDEFASGKMMRSLKHALGPARGTLCFSGAVITLCDLLRALADRIRNDRGGIASLILKCLLSSVIDLLQEIIRYISTFATIQAAATGEAFMSAARSVGELLVRNGMKSVTVWWLPNMVLRWTVMGASALLGVVTYGVSYALWKNSTRNDPFTDSLVFSITVGFTFLILMGWVAAFLKTATEVVYLCYVRDLDNRAVTRAAVHDVLKEVPEATGAVVLQPDDNMMYGALESGEGGTPVATRSDSEAGPLHRQMPPQRDLTAAIEAAPEPLEPQSLDPKGRL